MHHMNLLSCHHFLCLPNLGESAKPFLVYRMIQQGVHHFVHFLLCFLRVGL